MTNIDRPGLEQIDGSGSTDGDVPVWSVAGNVFQPGAPGVVTITGGTYVQVDATDPHHVIVTVLVPLTTLNSSGLPEIVFDSDGHIVYAEAP